MSTIGEILNRTIHFLEGKGLERARLNAEVLLADVLGQSRIDLYLHFDKSLRESELSRYRELIKSRLSGYPLQYLTGQTEFYSLTLEVSPAVLIPRPETELLVDAVRQHLGEHKEPLDVADVGTGCGNIAIALAIHLPQARLWATDCSPEALQLAQANAKRHGVDGRIHFLQGDLLTPLRGREGSLAAVVSNPPYVSTEEMRQLPVEIRHHEPSMALDGGTDGLDLIRRLVNEAPSFLSPEALLAIEVGAGQAQGVRELLVLGGHFPSIKLIQDYAGIDRMILAQRSANSNNR